MIHKTTRSILSVLLAALLLVASTPLTPAFADGGVVSLQSESAEGRALEPADDGVYYISTAEQLEEFADKVNDTSGQYTDIDAVLTADIDLSEICSEESDSSWTPIGNEDHRYTGTFDGDGHTISGLYINNSANYQGLFGYLSTDGINTGTVKDLTVSGTVSGGMRVGGIAGLNSGIVENCYNIGKVSGMGVGGVVGWNDSGTVKNCYNTGAVNSSGSSVGGVVGRSNRGNVINCYNTGEVSGNSYVGGVVGHNSSSVTNCYNTGAVSGGDWYVGGVVGYNGGTVDNGGTVENCYNTGTVTGSSNYVGGVVGWNSSSGTVTNCYNTGAVSGGEDVGGVVGCNNSGGSVTNSYNTGKVTGNNYVGGVVGTKEAGASVANCYFLQGTAGSGIGIGSGDATSVTTLDELCEKFENDNTNTWTISDTLNRPVLKDNHEDDGSKDHPYRISTATQLENFRDLVNGKDGNPAAWAVLMENITLNSSEEWTPIGNEEHLYTGTFDGDGHTISGLNINNSTANYQGLFGYVGTGGTVKDLSVSGKVSGNNYVGGVVGDNRGSVEDCDFTGSVTGTVDYVGGVVGYNGGTVKNCYNTGNISGNISDNTSGNQVGGIVGQNSGTVENCYNTGNISGDISIGISGGVVGWNDSGTVKNCYNTGNISGNTSGGVVGYNHSGGSVTNSYNTGAVSGDEEVGGVVGWNDGGSVTTSYNTGEVSGKISVGGVVGLNSSSTVTGCYFLQTADVNVGRPGIGGGSGTSGNVEARTADAFHSGEVAYLLQNGQKAAEGGVVPLVWGQSKLGETTSLPTLNPTDEQKVYQVTFDYGDSFTETDDRYDYHYANANDNVTLPTSTDQIPEYEGYTLTGWQDADKNPVTGQTVTITADTEFTAQWTANTIILSVTAPTFDPVTEGYSQPAAKSLTITNSGNTAATISDVTVNNTNFIITDGETTVSANGTNSTYTIQPVAGLAAGSYTATITVTYDNGATATAEVSFTVNEESTPDPTPTPDPEPSGPSTGDSTGWDDILDELENTENGDEITIDMGDETKVPAEIFESLAGKDVDVTFDLGDIQWSVNGADIPTDTDFTDLDLGASLGTSGIPVNVINTITGEVGTVQITLAHDGEFGFTMTLTAPLGKENAGYWANLYHYDEDAEALNFEAAAKIDEDGSVAIPFSHASQYAIVIDTHSHAAVDVSDLFIDIAPDAWYKDAIQYAYDNGLMTGTSANEFAPEATTTRAMIVSILARLEGVTTAEAAGFADVNDNDWYATAVNWAANVGVVNGYEDNTFQPNTAITREQLAAILMNYAAYKGEDVSNRASLTSYTDQPSTWAEEAISWSVAEGLLTGVTADTLQPQGAATRAQVAAILQRFLSE